MLLSIIISTKYTSSEILYSTINNIILCNPLDVEVIIVDQNSDRRMEKMINEKFLNFKNSFIKYVFSSVSGLSKGRNLGIEASYGQWLIFFDDDALIKNSFFDSINNILEQDKGKRIVYYGNVLNIENNKPYISRSFLKKQKITFSNFDTICSIGLIFNRKVFEEVGVFDENFGVGEYFGAGEEADMVLRCLEKKIPIIFFKKYYVYHHKSKQNFDKAFLYGRGLGGLYKKHLKFPRVRSIILSLKFLFEVIIRLIVAAIFFICLKFDKAAYHFKYLCGFVRGFINYKSL